MDINETHKVFRSEMTALATESGRPAYEIPKAQFMKETSLTEWAIRKAGGFSALKKLYFSPAAEDLETKYGSKLVTKHRNKFEKQVGETLFWQKEILRCLQTAMQKPWKMYEPPRRKKSKKSFIINRTLTVKVSDTHFGANISQKEVNGINEFTWEIAARRMAYLAEQVSSYKPHYRDHTELVIQLNGDILAGVIHDQEWFADLLTVQFVGALRILSQFISYQAHHFGQVRVTCSPGNHGRAMHKSSKERAMTHKWDSYENMLYLALREIFKSWKTIHFTIPESPYVIYKSQGHNTIQTHGDTIINVGNPGNSLNMRKINDQVNRVNASLDEPVAAVCAGHVHVPTVQQLECGAILFLNGCLSGLDPFANAVGNWSMPPTQIMYESTRKHAVGDIRMVRVKDGDNLKYLDKIIEPINKKEILD